MAGDDSSDLSSLSSLSPAPSEDELEAISDVERPQPKKGIQKYFTKVAEPKEPSPPPRKRSPSPPHEYVLADNPDIAFIVMFRSRFSDAFPKSMAHFGPQELEQAVVSTIPGDRAESTLCAVLGLVLNRKQDVKPGHYGRALEDAISSHKSQWAPQWEGKNPLSGNKTFNTMDPTERLTLLRTLILWSLSSSDVVKGLINQSYKQNRHEDDLNQPRSVQPWGNDGDKRRYFLIEGQDDSNFRVYRESNPAGTQRKWWSVAGSMEELSLLAEKLETKDGGPKAKKFAQRIVAAMPRFEAGEDKRKRREYRQAQKDRFKRPDPGFSMYEGRTRGKRMKYTYSDDEDGEFSDSTNRRSARNTGASTPVDTGPTITASGRQIKAPSRLNVATGESAPNSVKGASPEFDEENSLGPTGRPRRSAATNHGANGWAGAEKRSRRASYQESDEESEAEFGDDEEDADVQPEESEEENDVDQDAIMADDDDDLDDSPRSLVVKLSVTPPKLRNALAPLSQPRGDLPTPLPTGTEQSFEATSDAGKENAPAPMSNGPATEQKDVDAPMPDAPAVDVKDAPKVESSSTAEAEKDLPTPVAFTPAETPAPAPAPAPKILATAAAYDRPAPDIEGTTALSRPRTPESDQTHDRPQKVNDLPPTSATSLAFRGSPEKAQDAVSESQNDANERA